MEEERFWQIIIKFRSLNIIPVRPRLYSTNKAYSVKSTPLKNGRTTFARWPVLPCQYARIARVVRREPGVTLQDQRGHRKSYRSVGRIRNLGTRNVDVAGSIRFG